MHPFFRAVTSTASLFQGFASGDLDRDAFALRLFLDAGAPMLLAQSFAKNMGLYGERAVPFPTIKEVADGFASRERVEAQLVNHRDWIRALAQPDAETLVDAKIADANKGGKARLEGDKKLIGDPDAIAAFLAELPP